MVIVIKKLVLDLKNNDMIFRLGWWFSVVIS